MMPLQPFTRNFQDNSTDAGFQFTFFCDLCGDGYKTQFIESKTHKKGGLLRGLGRAVSIGGSLLGSNVGYRIEQGTDILSERFQGMSPEWHLSLIHISEPTRLGMISYAVFCLK